MGDVKSGYYQLLLFLVLGVFRYIEVRLHI